MGRLPDTDEWIPVDEHPEAIEEDMPGVVSDERFWPRRFAC